VIDALKKKLTLWKVKYLSFRGCVTLIDSVRVRFPLYCFSFFKVPKKVIKELASIQRRFLWCGGIDSRKACWVGWDTVCLPKNSGNIQHRHVFEIEIATAC
jgi:hypothetical protein